MELRDILREVFPIGTISRCRQDSFDIGGLPRGTEPKQCTILARGTPKSVRPGERRESYLVRTRGVVLYFRICSADPASGYAELVVGLDVAYTTEGQNALERRARAAIQAIRA